MNKILIVSDHAGYLLKEKIKKNLENIFEFIDLGPHNEDSISYVSQAQKMAKMIQKDENQIGIAICGTGIGISIALNRFKKIRAARVSTEEDAIMSRKHNNANILVFGGRQIEVQQAIDMIKNYINTKFEGGRHISRIKELDKKN